VKLPAVLSPGFVRALPESERKRLGKAGLTPERCRATFIRGQEMSAKPQERVSHPSRPRKLRGCETREAGLFLPGRLARSYPQNRGRLRGDGQNPRAPTSGRGEWSNVDRFVHSPSVPTIFEWSRTTLSRVFRGHYGLTAREFGPIRARLLCSRLLANCIIYYNACILSELLERAERRQDYQRADAIKRANPASWKHVNLYGAYSFLDIGDRVDLQELVNLLEAARGSRTEVAIF
jgi:Tn3 transposase DDE domain